MLPFWSSFPCVWSRCDTTRVCSECELFFLTLTWWGYRSKYPCHQMWSVSIDSSSFVLCLFTNIFLIMIVLFTRLFFTLLYSPYQGISFSSKVLRSELSYFRRSHSFSSTVWTTTSDQSFETIDFKSHSATCAHYVTTTNRPWVVESARSLSQTSVSASLSPFCIG